MATLVEVDSFKQTALPKNTLIVARRDGRLYMLDFSESPHLDDPGLIDWDLSVSKLLLAKITMSRTRLTTLEMLEFENIQHTGQTPVGTTRDMQIDIFPTLDGKNEIAPTSPYIAIDDGEYVRATCRVTGVNFAVQLRGTYNINTIQATMHYAGRR